MKSFPGLLVAGFMLTLTLQVQAQKERVSLPELPDLLQMKDGTTVRDAGDWMMGRRAEILELFRKEVYGWFPESMPGSANPSPICVTSVIDSQFLGGKATLEEIHCTLHAQGRTKDFRILLILPKTITPVPLFTGLNFYGNHTIHPHPGITVHQDWVKNNPSFHITGHRANAQSRGVRSFRWPVKTIIERGYGLATVYYGQFDPDYDDGFENGFHPLFANGDPQENKSYPGSISIWAKGMSLMLDVLLEDDRIASGSVIAIGHSRLGKTALWAAANDSRFAGTVSNNSGCGGAALSMRKQGETIADINRNFPHWFCNRFNRYSDNESRLPVDQHMLLALIAPRPVYVASATEDQWADPEGEFLALREAVKVYPLFGIESAFPEEMPPPDQAFSGIAGYHIRTGEHNILESDWLMYMNWADRWIR